MDTFTGERGWLVLAGVSGLLLHPVGALSKEGCATHTVAAGQTWYVSKTVELCALDIESGGAIVPPSGYSITLTVNGVETGQQLVTTAGVNTQFVPGRYRGNVVLTVSLQNPQVFGSLTYPIRQALYLDSTGVVADRSVLAAVRGGNAGTDHVFIASQGQAFNGIYATAGSHTVRGLGVWFEGDGRSDFAGDGAAVVANGTTTKVVLDGARIHTHGVVRTTAIATGGSTLIVKNSELDARQGTLPADYTQSVNTDQMRSVPWMLGINGTDNVRATNLLGPSTIAAYINSAISSDGWGVLSSDSGSDCTLVSVNSHVSITPGRDGYGTYAIGNVTEYLLGTRFDVGSYATINTGGTVHYGNSDPTQLTALNSSLGLGLTSREIASLGDRPTVIHSRRFGVMWHSSSGTVDVSGGTLMDTQEATFLDKSAQAVTITVDGSQGAQLHAANGVILQVMDDDDPGPQGSGALNDGVYVDPYFGTSGSPVRDATFDVTSTAGAAAAVFTDIAIEGNFYNSSGWTLMAGASSAPPGFPAPPAGKQNMALTFNNASVTGVLTSSTAHHHVATIDAAGYYQLGEVTNTPSAAINNGTIVQLNGNSKWTVTGTSYLTSLTVGSGARIVGVNGRAVEMTVNGVATPIARGSAYAGAIVMRVD